MPRSLRLPRAFVARDGVPSIERVDRRIFTLRYFTHCLRCGFCHDWCCQFGVDVEVKNYSVEPDWDTDRTVAHRVAGMFSGRDDVLISSFDPVSIEIAVEARAQAGLLLVHGVDPLDAFDVVPGIDMLLPPVTVMGPGDAERVVAPARPGQAGVLLPE